MNDDNRATMREVYERDSVAGVFALTSFELVALSPLPSRVSLRSRGDTVLSAEDSGDAVAAVILPGVCPPVEARTSDVT